MASPSSPVCTIDDVPREILERIFNLLPVESRLSAGLTCRRWLDILKGVFVHLTDVVLCFEDGYCQFSSDIRVQKGSNSFGRENVETKKRRSTIEDECCSGALMVNLCACPQHIPAHRHAFRIILMAAGRYVKKLVVEDYLLEKGRFVDTSLLEMFARRCPKLSAVELHHVDLSRASEADVAEIFPAASLKEFFLDQCAWASWSETAMNRVIRSIVFRAVTLREVHITCCPLLNDRTMQFIAKTCLSLWYVDFSGCKSITASGLSHFFYYMPQRQPDMLYIKIHQTRIDGNELQYFLYCDQHTGPAGRSGLHPSINIGSRCWAVCNFVMETGHRACSFQNRYVPGKSIIVFL